MALRNPFFEGPYKILEGAIKGLLQGSQGKSQKKGQEDQGKDPGGAHCFFKVLRSSWPSAWLFTGLLPTMLQGPNMNHSKQQSVDFSAAAAFQS